MEHIQLIFLFLPYGYFMYLAGIVYNLFPMLAQIMFLIINKYENKLKVSLTVFCTQGLVISIARFIYNIIVTLNKYYEGSGLLSCIIRFNKEGIISSSIYFCLLIIIYYLIFKNEIKTSPFKKVSIIIISLFVNLIPLIFIMIKFNTVFMLESIH